MLRHAADNAEFVHRRRGLHTDLSGTASQRRVVRDIGGFNSRSLKEPAVLIRASNFITHRVALAGRFQTGSH